MVSVVMDGHYLYYYVIIILSLIYYLYTSSFVLFSNGWLPIVKKLMEGRQTRLMNVGNLSDHTPLHLAAANGQDKVVKFLLDRGATVERYDITLLLQCLQGKEKRRL